jgi:hypothetical protein
VIVVVQKCKTTIIIQGNAIQGNKKNKGEVKYIAVVGVKVLLVENKARSRSGSSTEKTRVLEVSQ